MLKVSVDDVGGEIIKDDGVYTIKDNNHLKSMAVSSTLLRAKQKTSGHSHVGKEEVYYFTKGRGTVCRSMTKQFPVDAGDVILSRLMESTIGSINDSDYGT